MKSSSLPETYCTLFDSYYLTQGIALYESLKRNSAESFQLIVYCFDSLTFDFLQHRFAHDPCLKLVQLADFETAALLQVKPSRTKGEYCWTCTPFVILDAFKRFALERVTYLDADLFFFESPKILLDELDRDKNLTLLTEHRFSSAYFNPDAGPYCVQFMTFHHQPESFEALNWWAERCLEWCYARVEDGKFGDQRYLDDWTTRFKKVHVLEHIGGGVAPWNVQQYDLSGNFSGNFSGNSLGNKQIVLNKKWPLVFYHFHGLKILSHQQYFFSEYYLSSFVKRRIYSVYIDALGRAFDEISSYLRQRDPDLLQAWLGRFESQSEKADSMNMVFLDLKKFLKFILNIRRLKKVWFC